MAYKFWCCCLFGKLFGYIITWDITMFSSPSFFSDLIHNSVSLPVLKSTKLSSISTAL